MQYIIFIFVVACLYISAAYSPCGCPEGCNCTINASHPCDNGICFACLPNKWSTTCNNTCPTQCKTFNLIHYCHRENGSCVDCNPNAYGDDCSKVCSPTCKQIGAHFCDRTNGTCFDCDSNHWGLQCEKTCINCQQSFSRSCDRYNGTCRLCAAGYYGDNCDMKCPEGCLNGCNRLNGTCMGCSQLKWGIDCSRKCDAGCDQSFSCNQFDGHCDQCLPKFAGKWCHVNKYLFEQCQMNVVQIISNSFTKTNSCLEFSQDFLDNCDPLVGEVSGGVSSCTGAAIKMYYYCTAVGYNYFKGHEDDVMDDYSNLICDTELPPVTLRADPVYPSWSSAYTSNATVTYADNTTLYHTQYYSYSNKLYVDIRHGSFGLYEIFVNTTARVSVVNNTCSQGVDHSAVFVIDPLRSWLSSQGFNSDLELVGKELYNNRPAYKWVAKQSSANGNCTMIIYHEDAQLSVPLGIEWSMNGSIVKVQNYTVFIKGEPDHYPNVPNKCSVV